MANTDRAKMIWGVIYYNPDDPRVWVEMTVGYGWTLNFAHPQAATYLVVLMGICGVVPLALALGGAGSTGNFSVFSSVIIFFVAASAANLLAYRLNFSGAPAVRREWRIGVLGCMGILVGFAIQGVVNGGYVHLLTNGELRWQDHMFLAPVAAVSQTIGKVVVLKLLERARASSDFVQLALVCGLGVSLTELYLIALTDLAKAEVVTPLSWAVIERSSSAFFHIYSTGLLALALLHRRWILVAIVVVIHACTDFLAGLYLTTHFVTLPSFEVLVFVISLMTWALFLFEKKRATSGKIEERHTE